MKMRILRQNWFHLLTFSLCLECTKECRQLQGSTSLQPYFGFMKILLMPHISAWFCWVSYRSQHLWRPRDSRVSRFLKVPYSFNFSSYQMGAKYHLLYVFHLLFQVFVLYAISEASLCQTDLHVPCQLHAFREHCRQGWVGKVQRAICSWVDVNLPILRVDLLHSNSPCESQCLHDVWNVQEESVETKWSMFLNHPKVLQWVLPTMQLWQIIYSTLPFHAYSLENACN